MKRASGLLFKKKPVAKTVKPQLNFVNLKIYQVLIYKFINWF